MIHAYCKNALYLGRVEYNTLQDDRISNETDKGMHAEGARLVGERLGLAEDVDRGRRKGYLLQSLPEGGGEESWVFRV